MHICLPYHMTTLKNVSKRSILFMSNELESRDFGIGTSDSKEYDNNTGCIINKQFVTFDLKIFCR